MREAFRHKNKKGTLTAVPFTVMEIVLGVLAMAPPSLG